ncbi:MAG: nucleotidyl transferase AbiEii/AbiGii toxin family protein [Patescibacteria group bacterium]|nr:nucleotidyl transferase AbiEii/AbiGii toxin family protein [Patescibacteria group bacterium]MBU4141761.1 nucleotidyl transferase AbiEii/AbiGii toxin family protein [Patescibacteria group bacterium]
MLINLLKDFVSQKRQAGWPDFVINNALKEYLQYPVLAFIYGRKEYQNFIFTGGSALRIVYKLPRLSEDLDFNLKKENYEKLDLKILGESLQKYFQEKFLLPISYRVQGNYRIYLKFPILKQLGLASGSDSDYLYVKIEISPEDFVDPEYEIASVSGFGFNFIVKAYNLKFLMTGKISAILDRIWYKGKENEIDIKGRDYYDLYWYFEKGVKPDFSILSAKFGIKNEAELKEILKEKIEEKVTEKKLFYDLTNFFAEQEFVVGFCKNYKEIMRKYLG